MSVSLIGEYVAKRMGAIDLQNELKRLVCEYNKAKETYLFIYAADTEKSAIAGNGISLSMGDYQMIHEMLRNVNKNNIDFYLETPGGSGEAAEEIVKFLHNKFETVDFVIAGEAKSAGTLMAMSADEIIMTDSGSLGPIDAQVKIGRSVISAFDYVQWMESRRNEVASGKPINPVDATMIAQITPGEFEGVFHAQEFAVDKLKEWLPKYKFKHWKETETRKITVTEQMKSERAESIAKSMIDHANWRSHGRSLKISDLESLGLRIKRCEGMANICDLVYRIKTVTRLLFGSSTHYKLFLSEDESVFKNAVQAGPNPAQQQPIQTPVAEIGLQCPKCGHSNPIFAKFGNIPPALESSLAKKSTKFPKNNKAICKCGFTIDLMGLRNQLESQFGKKILD